MLALVLLSVAFIPLGLTAERNITIPPRLTCGQLKYLESDNYRRTGDLYRKNEAKKRDPWMSSVAENQKTVLAAIHILHRHLDDDMDGDVDLFESDEFLREELQYERGIEQRLENFHRNNDDEISVKELWMMWTHSPVRNWTNFQMLEWLENVVQLPQYAEKFRQLKINGKHLPRMAVNYDNFLSKYLDIKDVITRQKLSLKAQDVVLFGPPKTNISHTKDLIFVSLLAAAIGLTYFVYRRNIEMSKDLAALMKSAEMLNELKQELNRAKSDQESESKKRGDVLINVLLPVEATDEIERLQNEVALLQSKLHRAEIELRLNCWMPPPDLIKYLQITYDKEAKAHKWKLETVEKCLQSAFKKCEKLRKRRASLINAFIPVNSRSIDEVDEAVIKSKTAMTELTEEHKESIRRWNRIESLMNTGEVIER